jgi:YHS domain-containing protein
MKILSISAAVVLSAGMAWALQGKPINDTCPVKGIAVKSITSTYKGKTVAFCCGSCKGLFDANPEKYIANIPALAPPAVRTSTITSAADGVKSGKEGSKPVLILFMDATPKSKQWTEQLGDKSLDEVFGKIVYVAVDFKKDGDDEKKYSVTSAPTLVLVDASKDEPKGKKLSSPAPASLKKELEAAIKAATAK